MECKLVFCKHDGLVGLDWNEKYVKITLSSFGCDKGTIELQIEKKDDSLKKALNEWIQFVKQQACQV